MSRTEATFYLEYTSRNRPPYVGIASRRLSTVPGEIAFPREWCWAGEWLGDCTPDDMRQRNSTTCGKPSVDHVASRVCCIAVWHQQGPFLMIFGRHSGRLWVNQLVWWDIKREFQKPPKPHLWRNRVAVAKNSLGYGAITQEFLKF